MIITTEEKAKFITETSIGLATLITPRGLVKNAAELEKIARASSFATARIVERYSHLIPPGGHTPFVPGGGLFKHEAAGGHLIPKHVRRSEDMMKSRALNSPKISDISSFKDLNIAEQAVANTIQQNKSKIDHWLANNEPKLILNSNVKSSKPTGSIYNKDSNSFSDAYNTRIVILKDSSNPEKYKILTGFLVK